MSKRVKSTSGLNVPVNQFVNIEHMKHETIVIPATSKCDWGAQFYLDIKEKNCLIHNLILKFNVSAISGLTAGSAHYTPAWFWFNRIELLVNNIVIDTVYGNQQFILNQLFNVDEKRKFMNVSAGDYASVSQRVALASTVNDYYVPLWTFFKQTHQCAITAKDDIQLRVYMDSANNNVVMSSGATGVPVSVINSCSILANISKLGSYGVNKRYKELTQSPQHTQFNELRLGTFNISAGTANSSIVLSSIVGPCSFIYFTVRNVGSITGDGYYNYQPIKDFAILDSGSTNIVGGQAIPSDEALLLLNRDWTRSSYTTEIARSSINNNAYIYMYSFGASPSETMHTGKIYNSYHFIGSEQLQISFPSTLSNSVQIDVYAQCDAAVEITATYVKKISVH